ncbi:hypothetical protein [Maricaulis maris]|jgi:hypothetical protein|uniref:hypothetical protein n=1 Tax=Maricaulis maris TaxID=74318 RepID=UPI00291D5C91|nr:hypothetical protein MACH15_12780 [Maricaulis maris]
MRYLFALPVWAVAVLLAPVPAFALVSPPPEPAHGAGDSGGGNRILTLFNRAGSEEEDAAEAEEEEDPRSFTIPTVVAPLQRDGHLTGYAYVQIRVRVADGQNIWSVREDAHYALDAAVRAAFRNSVSNAEGTDLDAGRAVDVWRAALIEHYGAQAIDRVEIRQADIRLFR